MSNSSVAYTMNNAMLVNNETDKILHHFTNLRMQLTAIFSLDDFDRYEIDFEVDQPEGEDVMFSHVSMVGSYSLTGIVRISTAYDESEYLIIVPRFNLAGVSHRIWYRSTGNEDGNHLVVAKLKELAGGRS